MTSFQFSYRIEHFEPPTDKEIMHGYGFTATLSPEFTKACLELKLDDMQRRNLQTIGGMILNKIALISLNGDMSRDSFERKLNKELKEDIRKGRAPTPYEFHKDTSLIVVARSNGSGSLGCYQADIRGEYEKRGLSYSGHNVEHMKAQYELGCVWLAWANSVSGFLGNKK